MTILSRVGLGLAVAAMPLAVQAQDTVDGNLNVTTTVSVVCNAPTPTGTLTLPFRTGIALNNQGLDAAPVTVTVQCFGNPTVQHVDFDAGENSTIANADADIRYMRRDGSIDPADPSDFLGYQLFAIAGTEASTSTIQSTGTTLANDSGAATPTNRLTINDQTGTFSVSGRIFEGTERAGAFGDPTLTASSGIVPAGSYNDLVVMTVSYSG